MLYRVEFKKNEQGLGDTFLLTLVINPNDLVVVYNTL